MNYQDLQTQAHEALERAEAAKEAQESADTPGRLPLVSVHWAQFYSEDVPDLARCVLELLEENQRLQRLLDAARFRADLPVTSHGED